MDTEFNRGTSSPNFRNIAKITVDRNIAKILFPLLPLFLLPVIFQNGEDLPHIIELDHIVLHMISISIHL